MFNLFVLQTILFLTPEVFGSIQSSHSTNDYVLGNHVIIERTIGQLNKIKTIRYHQVFDQKSEKENRSDHVENDIYIEFLPAVEPVGFKFYTATRDYTTIYDGQKIYSLDTKTGKNAVTEKPVKSNFSGLTFIYNSIPAIKSNLPMILNDKEIAKTISVSKMGDFYLISFSMKRSVLDRLGGIRQLERDGTVTYEVTIDANTFLPSKMQMENRKNKVLQVTTFSDISVDSDCSHLFKAE
ncbi:hypothetical protein DSL64_06170 [Dyadobacter luteus]|jgi:hypothetical protein|uniref:Outer membrane lipoprotein carrier protein LolA n=1 Tax=Dyadobacter luteus TaxID=2259619 RepID=A0A3D8YF39_9BACT|nr:hypothetical protein [Dyadobacter luteus]REA63198.1 hypothetical protein DSL64_06170 [Dyadobacter luteus]